MAHARPTAETAGGGLTPDLEAQAHGCGREPHAGQSQSREAGEGVRRGSPGPRRPGAWGLGPEVAWTAPPARGVPLASREAFSVLALSRRQRKREKRWFSANVGD